MHIAIIFIYAFVSIQAEVGAFKINGKMCDDFTRSRTGVFYMLFLHSRFSVKYHFLRFVAAAVL